MTRVEGKGFERLLQWQGDNLRAQVDGEHGLEGQVDAIDAHLEAMEHGEILARERGIVGRSFGREDDAERRLRYGAHRCP